MGTSKKHKEKDREHKHKRRHRSRSRSPKDKERRHKHRESDRRVVDIAEHQHESHGHDFDDRKRRRIHEDGDGQGTGRAHVAAAPKTERPGHNDNNDSSKATKAGGDLSLSVEDTNKLRAKLGLKPLDAPGEKRDESRPAKKADVHVPAVNLAAIKKTEQLREKMAQIKEKRRINKMLGKVKTLADSDDDEDNVLSWVKKSRKIEIEREKAEQRAKALNAMDEEFGIGNLVEEEFGSKKKYTSKDLGGLTVLHSQDAFQEGSSVILTLKDKGILDEEDNDVLMNVNMLDDERACRNVDNKLKKPTYKPYDEAEFEDSGLLKPKDVLEKYNEEIDGEKQTSFALDSKGRYNAQYEKRLKEMRAQQIRTGEALDLPPPILATEYYTNQEMEGFKKRTKKTRKIRKKPKILKADDLLPLAGSSTQSSDFRHRGSQEMVDVKQEPLDEGVPIEPGVPIPGLDLVEMDIDEANLVEENYILGPDEDLTGVVIDDDAGAELEMALTKSRKLKQKKKKRSVLADRVLESAAQHSDSDETPGGATVTAIVLNATSEFCRSLGDIPSYGMAGNRDEEEDMMEFEREVPDQSAQLMDEEDNTGWQTVTQLDTQPVDIKTEVKAVLQEEPNIGEGLACALNLARQKGFLDEQPKKQTGASTLASLTSKNYSIEDKRYDDLDEKSRKRDRYSSGMVVDFSDKAGYKPNVKVEYVDDNGRMMTPKEAFRYLSHRFHGKGSGKRKTEKRSRKVEMEQLMKATSSTDTPLGTVTLLTEKQKAEKTPYVVLSGAGAKTSGFGSLAK